jgi:hypothetical protein
MAMIRFTGAVVPTFSRKIAEARWDESTPVKRWYMICTSSANNEGGMLGHASAM